MNCQSSVFHISLGNYPHFVSKEENSFWMMLLRILSVGNILHFSRWTFTGFLEVNLVEAVFTCLVHEAVTLYSSTKLPVRTVLTLGNVTAANFTHCQLDRDYGITV